VVSWTIAAVVASVIGWPLADWLQNHAETSLGMGSPFFNVGLTTAVFERGGELGLRDYSAKELWIVLGIWSAIYAVIAVVLYLATLLTFERCLGRSPERGRRRSSPEFKGSGSRTRPGLRRGRSCG
jgi:hypothetical protein